MWVELNADLGESWYDRTVGNDAALMPYLDSCNLACGFHGGDTLTQQRTIELALRHGVNIGAHPSFPDRKNFGRQSMELDTHHLSGLLLYQIGGLQALVADVGSTLHHLKLHGALYHYANEHPKVAKMVVGIARQLKIEIIYGPPAGELEKAAASAGATFWPEGFADRVYEPSLHLRSRQLPNASLDTPEAAAEQARELAANGRVRASDGNYYPLGIRTLCLHGDHAGAAERAAAVRAVLDAIPPQ